MSHCLYRAPALLLLAWSAIPVAGANQPEACSLATVAVRDAELNAAILNHNATLAAEYYADDFVLTTSRGSRKNKREIVAEIGTVGLQWQHNETVEVSVFGDHQTAVLTGLLRQKGQVGDQPFDVQLLVTDTWKCSAKGQWLLLAGHASRRG